MKKTTKKAKPGPKRGPRSVIPAAPAPVTPAANTTTNAAPPPAPVVRPRPLARMHRKSPAQKIGSELVRYLRIHSKHPYGKRGQKAILDLATRVRQHAQEESKGFTDLFPGDTLPFVEASLARLQQTPLVERAEGDGETVTTTV